MQVDQTFSPSVLLHIIDYLRLSNALSSKLEEGVHDTSDGKPLADKFFVCALLLAIVSQWHQEPKEKVVSLLLSHLPLLQPRNSEAKCEYMKLLQKVLSHTIESSLFVEESRQLLSYALIHPATTLDDRTSLAMWLNHLEEHLSSGYAPRAPSSPYHPHQGSDEWPSSAEALDPGNAWHDKSPSSSTSPAGQNGHMPFLGGMSSPINSNNTGNVRH